MTPDLFPDATLVVAPALPDLANQAAHEIRALLTRTRENLVLIGQKLQTVKAALPHGQWEAWLRREFDWSLSSAVKMMQVADAFKSVTVTDLQIDVRSLYQLAAPSTPEAARAEAITLAQNGAALALPTVQALIAKHRGVALPVAPAPPPLFAEGDAEAPAATITPSGRFGSGDYEWYTPAEVIARVREVLGTIDTDPASCALAQETVQAATYYTQDDDGLHQPWYGAVFLNPPYKTTLLERFGQKLLRELDAGHTTAAIVLVNNGTETDWFQTIAAQAHAICFPDGRIHFAHASRGTPGGSCQGQAVLYFGSHMQRFAEVFAAVGLLVQVVRAKDAGPQLALPQAAGRPSANS